MNNDRLKDKRKLRSFCAGSMLRVGGYDVFPYVKRINHNSVQCPKCDRILKIWSMGVCHQFVPKHKRPVT